MPSPQLERGYIRIANKIMDALISHRIPGNEMQCLLYLLRRTYGWNKKQASISYCEFGCATGLSKRNVIRAIKSLIEKRVILLVGVKNDTHAEDDQDCRANAYKLNKNYSEWGERVSKTTPTTKGVKSDTQGGVKNDTLKGVKSDTPKRPRAVVLSTLPDSERHIKDKYKDTIPARCRSDSLLDEYLGFSVRFLQHQHGQFPTLLKDKDITDRKALDCAVTLHQLVRIDGHGWEEVIKPTIWWAVKDEFWARNLLSLTSLRKRGRNGETKFTNILAKFQSTQAAQAQQEKEENSGVLAQMSDDEFERRFKVGEGVQ